MPRHNEPASAATADQDPAETPEPQTPSTPEDELSPMLLPWLI